MAAATRSGYHVRVRDVDRYLQRTLPAPGEWQPTGLRRAAVLCAIVERDGVDQLVFVLRPEGRHAHAGQIAFPGGMREGDESPLATALRECHEEVGAAPDLATPLGELSPLVSSSSIHVHCVVARLRPFEPVPDPREVARVLHAPLDELRDPARWRQRPPPHATPDRKPRPGPHYDLDGALLWGLTGRFVRELIDRLEERA